MPRPSPPRRRIRTGARLRAWAEHHGAAARETLQRLLTQPLATLMTVAAIAIALALPTALYLALVNLERLGGDWQRSAAISLFLQPDLDEAQADALAARLRARADLVRVEVIPRDRALAEFREYSGLGGALDALDENPLPVVLALYPRTMYPRTSDRDATRPPATAGGAAIESVSGSTGGLTAGAVGGSAGARGSAAPLLASLSALPETDFVRQDTQWAERLTAIARLLHQALLLLALTLGLAVLLVIGNTIRLEIENHREEILIMDLVGATMAFIRRPFLYSGAWYGLLGGLLAWTLIMSAVALLQGPVTRLAALYHTEFRISGLAAVAALGLIGGSVALGIIGSWLAVGRHLRRIDPA